MKKKNEVIRALKFVLISTSAGIVDILSFTLFFELFGILNIHTNIRTPISSTISLVLSVVWNFTINHKFTFKSAKNIKSVMLLTGLFYLFFAPAQYFLTSVLDNYINEYIVKAITMLLNFVLEYLYQRIIVYRNNCDNIAQKSKK